MLHRSKEVQRSVYQLRDLLGRARVAQSNSKVCGDYSTIRIYATSGQKGKPERALLTIGELSELRRFLGWLYDLQWSREIDGIDDWPISAFELIAYNQEVHREAEAKAKAHAALNQ